jgi:hypothetical protein
MSHLSHSAPRPISMQQRRRRGVGCTLGLDRLFFDVLVVIGEISSTPELLRATSER